MPHNEDEVVICPKNGVMLSDNQIVAAIRMLRAQFVDIGGLVDTVRFQKDISETFDLNLKEKSVFIIHCNGNHWVNFQSFLIIIFFFKILIKFFFIRSRLQTLMITMKANGCCMTR